MLNMLERHWSATEDALFATVEEALDNLSRGRFVILVDSRDPGSEGALGVDSERAAVGLQTASLLERRP
jgi:hypothetical protein